MRWDAVSALAEFARFDTRPDMQHSNGRYHPDGPAFIYRQSVWKILKAPIWQPKEREALLEEPPC